MADIVLPEMPAFGTLLRPLGAEPAAITVAERLGLGLATVSARRGTDSALRDRVRELFGIHLLYQPVRVSNGDVAFLGTAPGVWLAMREGAGNGFATGLAADLAGIASVADQSDGQAVLRLVGSRVPEALAKGMTLDLHLRVFRPGDVAVSSAARIGVILWRLADTTGGEPVYEVAVFRSYAESFWHWLSVSAAEFGVRTASDPAAIR